MQSRARIDGEGLSSAARSVWAKSPDTTGRWLPLHQHLADTAEVAERLLASWVPDQVLTVMAQSTGVDKDAVKTLATFLGGVHDIGKATPAFAFQNRLLAQGMREQGLQMPDFVDGYKLGHHTVTGHQILFDWLTKSRGFDLNAAETWAVVIGGHHGTPPTYTDLVDEVTHPNLVGRDLWSDVRDELLEQASERHRLDDMLAGHGPIHLSQQAQVLISGVVIVADWIASNDELFPYELQTRDRAMAAMRRLNLPRPWQAASTPRDVGELFAQRFDLPGSATPRPSQRAAVEAAWQLPASGLLILEAPMGEGKTEAALAAAEVLANRFGAGGVFVALPTQATSDAMFERICAWLDAVPGADLQVGASITLAHGKARLNRLYTGMLRGGQLREVDADDSSNNLRGTPRATAHAWLSGRKKATLATVVVGTIDQLLFAGLRSRHLALRHLAVAGKVVIIDEAHAYDCFMGSYLDKVLTWLGAYQVPTIVLSATLPPERREDFAAAYGATPERRTAAETGYPLLTTVARGVVSTTVIESSGRGHDVRLERVDDDPEALGPLLSRLLERGGTALVVRNTVRRALDAAAALGRHFPPGAVTLTHSRFLAADRAQRDAWLLDQFGSPERLKQAGSGRPHRHIVVGTQVVEQSLDVDFDVLVTDLAPVDLVLQRIGRLHRHERPRPAAVSQPRCYLSGVQDSLDGAAPVPNPGSVNVYEEYPLLSAAATLWPRVGSVVSLPQDIAPLVHAAYAAEVAAPVEWREALDAARTRWEASRARRLSKAERFQIRGPRRRPEPIIGWLSGSVGDVEDGAEGQGQVRDGAPSLECIVVTATTNGQWRTPGWLADDRAGLSIDRETTPTSRVANVMAECSLRLPLALSRADVEEHLWSQTPPAWESAPAIYQLPVMVLDSNNESRLPGHDVSYSTERGLEVSKRA